MSDRVLSWVNKVRTRHGTEPLASLPPGRGKRSPVERALGCKVTLGQLQGNSSTRITFIEAPDHIWRHIADYRRDPAPP
jgi:hypothetical protein